MRPADAPTALGLRRQRRTLLAALVASVLFHLGLLGLAWRLPAAPHHPLQTPLRFTIVERPSPPPRTPPRPKPPLSGQPGSASRLGGGSGQPAAGGLARPGGASGFTLQPDAPFAVPSAPPPPSLEAMSAAAAQATVRSRGPQHAPGNSIGERLAESLHRGTGAMAVLRSGFWDAYFTELRKVLLVRWSLDHVRAHGSKATTRIRLVLDGEGLLRDFDIVIASGDAAMDSDVERALHESPNFPPPPLHVMEGKVELVSEWEFTVHPGLAPQQGELVWGALGPGMAFDVVTLVNPAVDLKPLERNVALASYWTR
ncbi:MAG: TonB C-terminal domain-containing protein [Myxococcaceae bacterium]